MQTGLIIDLGQMFQNQFGSKPYILPETNSLLKDATGGFKVLPIHKSSEYTHTKGGHLLREQYLGIEIFLPIRIFDESGKKELMYFPYSVVRITGKKSYTNTPLVDVNGSIHELVSSEDYSIEIKGFLIGVDRKFPESELIKFKKLVTTKTSLVIDNAITNIYLHDETLKETAPGGVIIESWQLPEVSGGREHIRPFTMNLLSNNIFDLELE